MSAFSFHSRPRIYVPSGASDDPAGYVRSGKHENRARVAGKANNHRLPKMTCAVLKQTRMVIQ